MIFKEYEMAETRKSLIQMKNLKSSVRFTSTEFERIKNEREYTGKSIPHLLKDAYFKRPIIVPLINPKDQKALANEIKNLMSEVSTGRNTSKSVLPND
jgi:hypothetical protein